MYKKIFLALIAIYGLFLVVGCHKDSDEDADGYTVSIEWKSDDVYSATIIDIQSDKAYFRIDENLFKELPDWAGYYMGAADKWFYVSEWGGELHVGSSVKFRVEKIEYVKSKKYAQIPEPTAIHFYIKPAETE